MINKALGSIVKMLDDENDPDRKIVELVRMEDDGSLAISFVSVTKGMSPTMKMWHSKPGNPDFIDYQQRHGVTNSRRRSQITKELRNGEWREWQDKESDWS